MDAAGLSFRTTIGVDVKGETWSCIEVPDAVDKFGTGKSVRVDAKIDDVLLENVATLPTGGGGHMVSVNARIRKLLGKNIGDDVEVTITKR